jgi:hypothetical protein
MHRHTLRSRAQDPKVSKPGQPDKKLPNRPIKDLLHRLDRLYNRNYKREVSKRRIPRKDLSNILVDNQRCLMRMNAAGIDAARRSRWLRARLASVYTLSAPEFAYDVSDTEQKIVRRGNPKSRAAETSKFRAVKASNISDRRVAFWTKALFPEISRQTASRYAIIITSFKAQQKVVLPSQVYRALGKRSLHGAQERARRALKGG